MNRFPANIQKFISQSDMELLDGYIRFIDPQDIDQFLKIFERKEFWESDVPFATTAFGDIFAWNVDGYIQLYKMVDGMSEIIMSGDEFFAQNVGDSIFQKTYFDLELFFDAQKKYGKLLPDQCYAFIPIPALGGKKELNSVEVEPLLSYLALLSDTF